MTVDRVQCANCGHENPGWARDCESCGATLAPASRHDGPPNRIPTDQASLISIGAIVGTILLAVVVGLFISGLDPIEPTVGFATPTPEPTPTRTLRPTPTQAPTTTGSPDGSASPEPGPDLLGTVTFGTALASDGTVTNATDTFAPGSTFAHSVVMPEPFGSRYIYEVVVRVEPDGSETTLEQGDDLLQVNPNGRTIGFQVPTRTLVGLWGPGTYVMRVYRCAEGATRDNAAEQCAEQIAQATFTLVSG